MRDKYGVSQDSYCYKNSDVLVNKLNIENHDSLAEAELALLPFDIANIPQQFPQ